MDRVGRDGPGEYDGAGDNTAPGALEVSTDYLIGRSDQPTSSGPTAQKLFRHAENTTSKDLEFLESMAANLAKKNLDRGPK